MRGMSVITSITQALKKPAQRVAVEFDRALIERYDRSGPRYTSYPTADRFTSTFTTSDYVGWLRRRGSEDDPRPLSAYVHLPFCRTVCFYCACNKIVTGDRERGAEYLPYLKQEIAAQARLCDPHVKIRQLHWGGGTPTFYDDAQLADLMRALREAFDFAEDGEYSIEVDPRTVDAERVQRLRDLGFNRMSLGVQDFDPVVQRAVNRIQTVEQTLAVMQAARAAGFASLSVDLIYGLPHQRLASFEATLEQVIAAAPDRVSVYNYAHLPHLFKPQQRIDEADLPPPALKLEILQDTISRLQAADYVYIGMDHFARADDELVLAQQNGTLQRNFQGYSTHADCDMVAMGVTAIGKIGPTYSQNQRVLTDYYATIARGELPILRGYVCNTDDLLRREIIATLMCRFELDFAAVSERHAIVADDYFAPEFADLARMAEDGLIELQYDRLTVTPRGRLLIRNICMVFDRYLRGDKTRRAYSRVI
jgi:oxygen-independent coproporphyrinogen-3 oxidase